VRVRWNEVSGLTTIHPSMSLPKYDAHSAGRKHTEHDKHRTESEYRNSANRARDKQDENAMGEDATRSTSNVVACQIACGKPKRNGKRCRNPENGAFGCVSVLRKKQKKASHPQNTMPAPIRDVPIFADIIMISVKVI